MDELQTSRASSNLHRMWADQARRPKSIRFGPDSTFQLGVKFSPFFFSKDVLQLNQGSLYPALLRMEQEGWIASKWRASEKNRKAKFYSLTAAGRRRLIKETEDWRRMSSTIDRFFNFDPASLAEEQG